MIKLKNVKKSIKDSIWNYVMFSVGYSVGYSVISLIREPIFRPPGLLINYD